MKHIYSILFAMFCVVAAQAQEAVEREQINARWFKSHYTKSEQMVPMRDGTKLYTAIFTPKNKKSLHPILLNRTENGCEPYGKKNSTFWQEHIYEEYLHAEYVFVFQDVRGSGKSGAGEGDESQDAFDTAEWLLRKVRKNNGCVGVWGFAKDANYAYAAAKCGHHAIKCASVQAPMEALNMEKVATPILFVGGNFDSMSGGYAWSNYQSTQQFNPALDCRLVVGPWAHGQWRKDGEGETPFYITEVEFPFFDHFLRNAESSGASASGALVYFTGENCWRELDGWSSMQDKNEVLYFNEEEALFNEQPYVESSFTRYNVVKHEEGVEQHDNTATYLSPVLVEDVAVAGAANLVLYATASQPVADFIIKLIDVTESDGEEMLVRQVIVTACKMGQTSPEELQIKLPDMAHTFMAGHRIKILVEYVGKENNVITLYHDRTHPTQITFPLQ